MAKSWLNRITNRNSGALIFIALASQGMAIAAMLKLLALSPTMLLAVHAIHALALGVVAIATLTQLVATKRSGAKKAAPLANASFASMALATVFLFATTLIHPASPVALVGFAGLVGISILTKLIHHHRRSGHSLIKRANAVLDIGYGASVLTLGVLAIVTPHATLLLGLMVTLTLAKFSYNVYKAIFTKGQSPFSQGDNLQNRLLRIVEKTVTGTTELAADTGPLAEDTSPDASPCSTNNQLSSQKGRPTRAELEALTHTPSGNVNDVKLN